MRLELVISIWKSQLLFELVLLFYLLLLDLDEFQKLSFLNFFSGDGGAWMSCLSLFVTVDAFDIEFFLRALHLFFFFLFLDRGSGFLSPVDLSCSKEIDELFLEVRVEAFDLVC